MASLYQSLGIAPRDKAYIVGHLAGGVGAAYAARDDESRRLSNHDRRPGRPRLAGCGDGSRRDGRPSSSQAAGAPGRAVGAHRPGRRPRPRQAHPAPDSMQALLRLPLILLLTWLVPIVIASHVLLGIRFARRRPAGRR